MNIVLLDEKKNQIIIPDYLVPYFIYMILGLLIKTQQKPIPTGFPNIGIGTFKSIIYYILEFKYTKNTLP